MKWKYYPLRNNDSRARKQVLANVAMGAQENHALPKKLLSRFSDAIGPFVLVAFESLDLDGDYLYEYATYNGGKADAGITPDTPQSDSPIGGLILFIQNFLRATKNSMVLCDNWIDTRTKYLTDWRPRESRTVFCGEDVYHILISGDDNYDAIECAIRESTHHWGMGVCSSCAGTPQTEILSEAFIDEIVASTVHIFTPALDGEGYLIWSPESN